METGFSPKLVEYFTKMRAAQDLRRIPDAETPLIEVDEAVRSIAGFYERTRNTLEYGEADFLRQRAIERALKRRMSFGVTRSFGEEGMELLLELIRAGYFPNAAIPESVAETVGIALERLFTALRVVPTLFHDELLKFASFEIEEAVFPERAAAQEATMDFAIETCDAYLKWPKAARTDRAHRAFLFVAAHRVFLQASNARILFAFLSRAFPAWRDARASEIPDLAEEFSRVLTLAKRTVAHSRCEQYGKALRKFAAPLQALDAAVSAIIAEDRDATLSVFDLERRVEEAVVQRVGEVKRKLRTAAVRATAYVFFTKMVVGLGIEVPYDSYVHHVAFSRPFWINLLFPPLLMFFVAFSARPPRQKAVDRVVEDAMRLATAQGVLEHVRLPRQRGRLRLTAFTIMTIVVGALTLWAMLRWLRALEFSIVSTAVFLVFFSVVSLFAWRVRRPLRDFAVSGGGGVRGAILEILLFPFLALGRLLSDSIRSVNVFLFLLDVIIEAPLKFFFSMSEDWLAFLREKRERFVEE